MISKSGCKMGVGSFVSKLSDEFIFIRAKQFFNKSSVSLFLQESFVLNGFGTGFERFVKLKNPWNPASGGSSPPIIMTFKPLLRSEGCISFIINIPGGTVNDVCVIQIS